MKLDVATVPPFAGYAGTREVSRPSARSPPPPLLIWLIVGSVPDGVAEAPSPTGDRRLELPFVLEVAAA